MTMFEHRTKWYRIFYWNTSVCSFDGKSSETVYVYLNISKWGYSDKENDVIIYHMCGRNFTFYILTACIYWGSRQYLKFWLFNRVALELRIFKVFPAYPGVQTNLDSIALINGRYYIKNVARYIVISGAHDLFVPPDMLGKTRTLPSSRYHLSESISLKAY